MKWCSEHTLRVPVQVIVLALGVNAILLVFSLHWQSTSSSLLHINLKQLRKWLPSRFSDHSVNTLTQMAQHSSWWNLWLQVFWVSNLIFIQSNHSIHATPAVAPKFGALSLRSTGSTTFCKIKKIKTLRDFLKSLSTHLPTGFSGFFYDWKSGDHT